MHGVCILRHGVSSRSRRGIGVHGGRAAAAARRATPRSRSRRSPPTPTRAPRSADLYPSLAAGVRAASTYAPLDADRPRRARRRVPARCRTGESQRLAARPGRHGRPRRRPRRRLPAPGRRLRAVVRRGAHRARADRPVRVRAARALPRRDRGRRARRRRPAATRPRRRLALAPLLAAGPRRADGHRRRRGVGRLGRGPRARRPRACSPRRTRTSPPTACSRTATPRRWSRRSTHVAGAAGAGAVHAAPRADDAGHPRHLLRAARGRAACRTDGLLDALPRLLRRRAVRASSIDEPPAHQGDATAPTSCTSPCASTTRTDTVLAIGAEDNLVKGASGQAIQTANLVLGLPETTGLPHRRDCMP